ncbi:MAG TPA: hypothetical protein VF701_04930 [Thermoanaerobaculia bacterium]
MSRQRNPSPVQLLGELRKSKGRSLMRPETALLALAYTVLLIVVLLGAWGLILRMIAS